MGIGMQAEYRRVLEGIASEHGHKPIARLEPRHIYAMQDALQNKPGAANTLVRMMRLLLSFAQGSAATSPPTQQARSSCSQSVSGVHGLTTNAPHLKSAGRKARCRDARSLWRSIQVSVSVT